MKVYRSFFAPRASRGRSVAVGVFDGVHRGHRKILAAAIRTARASGACASALTFDPDPARILAPKTPHPILQSLDHRLRHFKECGLDEAFVIRFNKTLAALPRERFLGRLVRGLGMTALSVGEDFRFGKGGLGDVAFLRRESKRLGFRLNVVRALRDAGKPVSSTRIRRLVEAGRLDRASSMLGRPVSVFGTVVRGHGRGRKIGFPTANLDPHHEAMPPDGVYAAWGFLGRKWLRGVIHIGRKPTFGDREKSLEVHFLDFDQTLYGRDLELVFVKRLRGIHRFRGPNRLRKAIASDVSAAQRVLKARPSKNPLIKL